MPLPTSFVNRIANLLWWHEPSQGGLFQTVDGATTSATADGEPVGYIPDQSGKGHHLYAAGSSGVPSNDTVRSVLKTGANGINGRNTVLIDGSPKSYIIGANGKPPTLDTVRYTGYTSVIVFRPTGNIGAGSGSCALFSKGDNIGTVFIGIEGGRLRIGNGYGSFFARDLITTNNVYVLSVRIRPVAQDSGVYDFCEVEIRVNGAVVLRHVVPPGNSGYSTSARWRFGGLDNNILHCRGDLALNVAASGFISDDELDELENYAAYTYGSQMKYKSPPPAAPLAVNTVWVGNSICTGQAGGGQAASIIYQRNTKYPQNHYNISVGGRQMPTIVANTAINEGRLFVPGSLNRLVVWEIINHLSTIGNNPTTVQNVLRDYCIARRLEGWEVYVVTGTVRYLSTNMSQPFVGFNDALIAINAWIRANWQTFADGIVDVGGDPRFAANPADPLLISSDGVHLFQAGHEAAESIFRPVLEASVARYLTVGVTSAVRADLERTSGDLKSVKAKTDALPANVASVGDVPTVSAIISDLERTGGTLNLLQTAVGDVPTATENAAATAIEILTTPANKLATTVSGAVTAANGGGGGGGSIVQILRVGDYPQTSTITPYRLTTGDTRPIELPLVGDRGEPLIFADNAPVTFTLREVGDTGAVDPVAAELLTPDAAGIRYARVVLTVPDIGEYEATFSVGGVSYPLGRRIKISVKGRL
ncbi:MAG: hypothetical protein H7Y38_16065 [Armatimonadetes bacterium]|nr:hypothetical protein [Armatimonadota bacterium]